MIPTLHDRLKVLEGLVARALERVKELEAENKRLASELAFHEKEAEKGLESSRKARAYAEAHDRVERRLRRLRDRLVKIEQS